MYAVNFFPFSDDFEMSQGRSNENENFKSWKSPSQTNTRMPNRFRKNTLNNLEKFYNFLNLCQILDPSNSEFQNILNIPKSRPNSPNPVIIDNEEASNVKATGTKDVGPG